MICTPKAGQASGVHIFISKKAEEDLLAERIE